MRMTFERALMLAVIVVTLCVRMTAQEGHPLTGTWYGEYGTGAAKKDITVIMKWDGSKVTGLINPGPNAVPIKSVVLDIIPGQPGTASLNNPGGTQAIPPVFNVKFEVGDMAVEGRILNPVGGNRSLVGTYVKGAEKGPFQMKHL